MVAKRYAPPNTYVQAGDLIPYWRKDGVRPILYTDDLEHFDKDKVLRYLMRFTDTGDYVDYVICSEFQQEFVEVCRQLSIPTLTYEGDGKFGPMKRWMVQAISAQPTHVTVFYTDPVNILIRDIYHYCDEYAPALPREWISW